MLARAQDDPIRDSGCIACHFASSRGCEFISCAFSNRSAKTSRSGLFRPLRQRQGPRPLPYRRKFRQYLLLTVFPAAEFCSSCLAARRRCSDVWCRRCPVRDPKPTARRAMNATGRSNEQSHYSAVPIVSRTLAQVQPPIGQNSPSTLGQTVRWHFEILSRQQQEWPWCGSACRSISDSSQPTRC